MQASPAPVRARAYAGPFVVFLALLALRSYLPFGPGVEYPLRVIAVTAVLVAFSRRVIDFRFRNPVGSVAMGIAVFVVWIAPDVLWPGYRSHWLLVNPLTGGPVAPLPVSTHSDPVFLVFRVLGAAALVPVVEELFWRGWLMRWLIDKNVQRVPLGTFQVFSFWVTALLFAVEHGRFWEVGLLAGIAYNWWMVRTRSLADCILAHAVTNACLAAYVLAAGKWEYWA